MIILQNHVQASEDEKQERHAQSILRHKNEHAVQVFNAFKLFRPQSWAANRNRENIRMDTARPFHSSVCG